MLELVKLVTALIDSRIYVDLDQIWIQCKNCGLSFCIDTYENDTLLNLISTATNHQESCNS